MLAPKSICQTLCLGATNQCEWHLGDATEGIVETRMRLPMSHQKQAGSNRLLLVNTGMTYPPGRMPVTETGHPIRATGFSKGGHDSIQIIHMTGSHAHTVPLDQLYHRNYLLDSSSSAS